MRVSDLNRRDFNKLTMAALGGLAAGVSVGCSQGEPEDAPPAEPAAGGPEAIKVAAGNPLLEEPHVCRGLNTCKGKGADKSNACAGQGSCASAGHHACGRKNACKGEGGCGANPGENACKGQGDCAVPLTGNMWTKARKNFEEAMKSTGKEVGQPPAS